MNIPAAQEEVQKEKKELSGGFFFNIQKSFKEDPHARPIALYLGLTTILVFLVIISLAPQVSQKLGLFSQRKEKEQTFAQEANKRPKVDKVRSANVEESKGAVSSDHQTPGQGTPQKEKEKTSQTPTPRKTIGELYGQVIDLTSEEPLEGAEIAVENQYFKTTTTTDKFGNFQILDIPAGKYAVEVQKSGYRPQKNPLILQNGDSSYLEFSLEK